jgi:signal transduction histidine kinase
MEQSNESALVGANQFETLFASPEVLDAGELTALCQGILDSDLVTAILDAVAGYAMVLSETRQILGINQSLAELLELSDPVCFLGLRPGDLLACLHAEQAPSGCGTGLACRACGAVLSILAAQASSQPAEGECCLLQKHQAGGTAKEFKVRATPLVVLGQRVIILVLQDISGAKRKEALERVFLHDLQNTLTGVVGLSELARVHFSQAIVEQISTLAMGMGLEIRSQQTLLKAEKGTLVPSPTTQTCQRVLARLEEQLVNGRGRTSFSSESPDATVTCDQSLLSRVLLNMATNALEAAFEREVISVRHSLSQDAHVFCVHNDAVIPLEARELIFHRTFSTKGGSGRGLGTYSMKLLGEQYLRGKVWFETGEDQGTTFYLSLPRK